MLTCYAGNVIEKARINICALVHDNAESYPRAARWGSLVVSVIDVSLFTLRELLAAVECLALVVVNVAGSALNLLGKCCSFESSVFNNSCNMRDAKESVGWVGLTVIYTVFIAVISPRLLYNQMEQGWRNPAGFTRCHL